MRIAPLALAAALSLPVVVAAQAPRSMSDIMVKVLYPTADAVFYIETRTPTDEAGWQELQRQTRMLSEAAVELTTPRWARAREQWLADAQLLVDASAAAVDAASKRNVKALADLNDALYTSCVQCHQHYRANYGSRPTTSSARAQTPDLQGVWSFATLTPLERPAEFGDKATLTRAEADAWVKQTLERNNRDRRDGGADVDVGRAVNDYWFERGTGLASIDGGFRTSLVTDPADGKLPPLTADARTRAAARAADNREHPADGPANRSLQERCLTFNAGPPMLPGPYNNYVQIFQMPGYVIIVNEMIHDARIVALDGRPHAPPSVRSWLGDSRGRWDGDTLVVDTTNFNGKTNLRGADENLHLVERFRRVNEQTLLYEFTVDDPTAYTNPWTASLPMTKTEDRIFEYACHEGNYALEDILRGARYQEKIK
jgi:mono/diheme cytochrome c family protein